MAHPIEYLVIHCTATPVGREVSADDIRRWHTSPTSEGGRGWKQVGYTDLIHLDGRIERLVDNNEDAQVDPWEITNGAKGYNSVSRHIAYVGGCSRHSGSYQDTRTPEQEESMAEYVKAFHHFHPGAKIVGHCQLAPKACPCFDVPAWLQEIGITPPKQ